MFLCKRMRSVADFRICSKALTSLNFTICFRLECKKKLTFSDFRETPQYFSCKIVFRLEDIPTLITKLVILSI